MQPLEHDHLAGDDVDVVGAHALQRQPVVLIRDGGACLGEAPADWRDAVYYRYYEFPHGWHRVRPHYGIRTDRYKLIHFGGDMDVWELFDFDYVEGDELPEKITRLHEKLVLVKGYMHRPQKRSVETSGWIGADSNPTARPRSGCRPGAGLSNGVRQWRRR